jgi:probable FeS assembly SUF system protein SufT
MMNEQSTIVTKRDITARLVPSGTRVMVPKGSFVNLRQALGGSYTVTLNGNMLRIDGTDADAIGQEGLDFHFHDVSPDGLVNEEDVWQVLSTIFDPEIPVNIVSLGLVYACDIIHRDGKNVVQIRMTLTAPTCGMGSVLQGDVEDRVSKVPNVDKVEVEIVFDPPWTYDNLSEEAQIELGLI